MYRFIYAVIRLLYLLFMRMRKEKEKSEWATYLGEYAGFHLFSKWVEDVVVNEKEWWYAYMCSWSFHKQTHICKTRTELRKKIEHNKAAKELCQIFNKDFN